MSIALDLILSAGLKCKILSLKTAYFHNQMKYTVVNEESADYLKAFGYFWVYFTVSHCSVGKILGIDLHKWQWMIAGWQWPDLVVFILICFNLALAPANWSQSSPSCISTANIAF